ncbi:MAG TPA: methyl-accepting chemotaxis protein [Firmicutes bacterium]|nr:methyl-accepting chemotaxis protein [Bacillota bacterium]
MIRLNGIRSKLILGFLVVLIIMGISSGILYIQLSRQNRELDRLMGRSLHYLLLAHTIKFQDLTLADAVRGVLIDPEDQNERARYNSVGEELDKNLKDAEAMATTQADRDSFKRLGELNQQLVALEATMMKEAGTNRQGAVDTYKGQYTALRNQFAKELEAFVERQNANMTGHAQAVLSAARRSEAIALIIIAIAILIALLIGLQISTGLARPIVRLMQAAELIAKGDLTVNIKSGSTDEIGRLSSAFAEMVSSLRHLIKQVTDSSAQVASTSEQLSVSAEESAKAVQQISETVQQVASGAQEQSQSAASSASSVEQLTQAITQVAKGAETQMNSIQAASNIMRETDESLNEVLGMLEKVGAASSKNAESAAKGSDSVKNVIASMERIRGTTNDVAERIRELDGHSREIGRILEVIDGIAEQTNLLALNAAIEAARAGEHGRGFAVVADEVRKLAERSSKETKAIADLIERVKQATQKAVEAIDAGTKEVETGSAVAHEAGIALDEIYEGASGAEKLVGDLVSSANSLKEAALNVGKAINEIVSIAEENTAATEEMSASAEEVKKSIDSVAAVSEESAAAAEEVSASTEEVNASIQEMSASAESLAEMAQKLQELVARFKV